MFNHLTWHLRLCWILTNTIRFLCSKCCGLIIHCPFASNVFVMRDQKKKTGKGWCSTVAVPLLKINVFLVLVLEVSLVYLLIEPHKVVHIFRLCLIMCHQSYKELKRAWKVVDLHPNRCSLAASIFLTAELVCRNPENLSGGEPKFRSFPEEFS